MQNEKPESQTQTSSERLPPLSRPITEDDLDKVYLTRGGQRAVLTSINIRHIEPEKKTTCGFYLLGKGQFFTDGYGVHVDPVLDIIEELSPSDIDSFQSWCVARMCKPTTPERDLMLYVLGLAGEAGEVSDVLKKSLLHGHGVDKEMMKKELGDVLFYVVTVCHLLGFSSREAMWACEDKINARYPHGFDPARAHKPGEAPIEDR